MPLRTLNLAKAGLISITDTAGTVYNYKPDEAKIYVDNGGIIAFEKDHAHYHPLQNISEIIVFWRKENRH